MRELIAALRRLWQVQPPPQRGPSVCGFCGSQFEAATIRDKHSVDCPAAHAAFARLSRQKQLAVMSWISSHLSRDDGLSYEEASADALAVVPELAAMDDGMGPAAVQGANTMIILHLVKQLARERGESEADTWRREIAEMLREPDGG